MRSGPSRLLALAGMAVLLASCEDPVEPEQERPGLEAQGPRSSNDPQAWAVSSTGISLYWPDNSSNETGWEVHRSTAGRNGVFSLLAQTASNVTDYSDVGLTPNTEYCYRVRWFRKNGKNTTLGSFTIVFCGTTYGPPSAPDSARAIPATYGRVYVAWISTSFTTNGFRIQRGPGSGGPWVEIASHPSWSRSYEDSGRPMEQQVCYRVIAFNDWGQTASNVACTTPPAPPDSLKASSPDEHSIALTWKDRSSAEDGYEVQRARGDWVWSAVATLRSDATSYRDGGLATDTRYYYRLRSINDGGFSDFSPMASAFTASMVPATPNVTAVPRNSSTVDVAIWGSEAAEGFRVDRSADGGMTWEPLAPNSTVDEDRNAEHTVHYRVVAFNRLGESPPATDSTTPPAAPSNLTATPIDDRTNEITWSDNSAYEDGYQLWLSRHEEPYYDDYYYPVDLPPNTTSYPAASTEQLYGVVALKDGGYSDWAFPAEVISAALQNQSTTVSRPPASSKRTPPTLRAR